MDTGTTFANIVTAAYIMSLKPTGYIDGQTAKLLTPLQATATTVRHIAKGGKTTPVNGKKYRYKPFKPLSIMIKQVTL